MLPLTRLLRATAVVCALAGLSAPVAAATFDVVKQRARLTDDGTGLKQVRGLIDMPVNGKQERVLVRAGSYHLKKRIAGSSDA